MKQPMRADPEQKYRTLYEFTSDAVMLLNERNFFDCNPATLKMFGCATREQFLGKHPSEFSPEFQPGGQTSASLSQQRITTALREGTCHFEWQHCRLDGTEFPAEVWLTAMDLGGEKVLQAVVRDITERKRAEEVMRESQQRFQGLVETLSDWIWEVDQNGAYTYVSPKVKDLLGYEPKEVLGKTPFDLMPSEEAQRVAGIFGPLLAAQQPLVALENTNRHKDGHLVVFETNGVPFFDAEGRFKGYRGTDRDITERKQAEEELREREEKYRTILETIQDGYYEVDIAGNLTFFNDSLRRLYGYSKDELMGMNYRQYMDDETAKAIYQTYNTVYRTGNPTEAFGCGIIRKDGTRRFVQVSVSLMRGSTGEPVGFRGIARDVTERQRAQETLQESEQRFRTLAEASFEGIVLSEKGVYVDLNDQLASMLGYARNELIGKPLWETVAPESRELVAEAIRSGRIEPYEHFAQRKDGTTFPVEVRAGITQGADRQLRVTAIRDITERKRAEEESHAARQRLLDIIDFLPDATFVIDQDRKVIAWNRAAEEITGTRKEDILGQGDYAYALPFWGERRPILVDFLWMEDSEFRSKYPSIQKKGDTLYTEVFVPHMYGGRGAVLWATAAPLLDSEGNQVGAIESVRDVTQRKRAEETLTQERNLLRTLIDNLPDLVYVKDTNSRFILCNSATARHMGATTPDELVGKSDMDWYPQELAARFHADEQAILQSGQPLIDYEEPNMDEAGNTTWLLSTKVPLRDSQGKVVGLVGIGRDITERKRAEEESHAARQRLLDIIDFLPDATFVIDQDKKVIAWNRAIEEMSGARKEDILGQGDYAYALPFWGERRPIIIDLIGVEDPEFESKYAYVQRQGNTLYAEVFVPSMFGGRGADVWVMASPLLDSHGNQVGAIESIRDITERKRLERQIQESLARRGVQVQTSTEVAQEIAAAPALDELFHRVVTLVKERFGYYHAQIFRHEPSLNAVVLVSGYGEAGQKMLAAGHRLEMGRGVVGTAAATGQAILAANVTQDKDWRPNPNLPDTKGELAVPIKLRGQVLGILDVQSDRAGALTAEDQLLLEGLCGQIAVAMEDTRLRQETEERLRELTTLYRATSREGWEAFRQVAELPSGYLFDRTVIQPAEDLWTPEIARAVEQQTLVSSAPSRVAVSKVQESQDRGATVAPLSVRGEVVGALGVYDDPQHPMSSDDLALVESVSEQVALALDSARLYEQTQARARREQTLREITARVRSSTDPDAVMRALVRELGTVLGRSTFVRLGSTEDLSEPKAPRGQAPVTPSTRGNGERPGAEGDR